MECKNIAFFNSSKSWGGGEKWHFEASCYLQKSGHNIHFFCNPDSEIRARLKQEGIQTHPLQIRNLSFLNPFKLFKLGNILKDLGIATVIMNSPADAKLAGPAARLAAIPNIIFRRGMPHPISGNFYNRWLFNTVIHKVIANSRAVADSLDASLSGVVPHNKLVIIENGITFPNIENIKPLDLGLDKRLVLTTAGRMVRQKNQRFLIDVADQLRNKGCEFQLVIAGTGKLKDELENAVAENKLGSSVFFPGFIEDMPALLAATDIFLFPSLYEGSPNTLIEAAGAGLPVVASDIPPSREILPDNTVGRLLTLGDTEGFCNAICELANDPSIRENIGNQARKRVRKIFNLDSARAKLTGLI